MRPGCPTEMNAPWGTANGSDHAPPMLVYCCAGMRRSGSTLQAQLVAELLGGLRISPTSPQTAARQLAEALEDRGAPILKCHQFIPEIAELQARGGAKVLCSHRDIRDVVASSVTKYSIPAFSFVHGGALAILREHAAWSELPDVYDSKYEEAQSDLPAEIQRLANFLGIELTEAQANVIANKYGVEAQRARIKAASESRQRLSGTGSNRLDKETLLHLNHIQSGEHGRYRQVLKWYQIAALEWVCRDWISDKGYIFDYPAWLRALSFAGYELRAVSSRLKRSLFGRRSVE